MDLEEQIFHVAVLVCIVGVFIPWFGGVLYEDMQLWNGFSYYTAYIGRSVFVIQLFLLLITLSPMLGGPIIIRKTLRSAVRLLLSGLALCLLLAAFSVLIRINTETPKYNVRIGLFISLIASIVETLYAFLRFQQTERGRAQETFRHPDEELQRKKKSPEQEEASIIRPPPPPPPPPLEEHRPFTASS